VIRVRKLTSIEEKRLSLLTANSVEVTLIEPTTTGLKKSILDATEPVRRYLVDQGIHDYDRQKQGQDHKVVVRSYFVEKSLLLPSQASLYRPVTKQGDPRIWFKGLPNFSRANDILALIAHEHEIYVVNLSKLPLEKIIEELQRGPLWELVQEINKEATQVSEELLRKLMKIAKAGPLKSLLSGRADTAVGRTLEKALGIGINSKKEPDYKGIELKSFRSAKKGKENRKTLFAQVPNWELSQFKSSRQILENFGYARDKDFKLYCTVSTRVKNSQGLRFKINQEEGMLVEFSDQRRIGDFASWSLDDLRQRLLEKHNETFWVAAKSQDIKGAEYFQFTKILHTRKPIVSQFDILIEQGIITMDHLIKRSSSGRVSEKGPLFKIESSSLEMLFPPSKTYDLLTGGVA